MCLVTTDHAHKTDFIADDLVFTVFMHLRVLFMMFKLNVGGKLGGNINK